MTEADLRELLRNLADHLAVIIEDLEDTAWPASGGTNLGAAPVGPKSKAPCNVAALDYIITDVGPRVKGWCRNLCEAGGVTLSTVAEQPLNVWVAWLSRHRTRLLAMPWAQDAVDELRDLEAELQARLYPDMTRRQHMTLPPAELPSLATTGQLCDAYGVQPATIRKWKERGKILPAMIQTLSAGETVDLWRCPSPDGWPDT